jgi:hypothetical protein
MKFREFRGKQETLSFSPSPKAKMVGLRLMMNIVINGVLYVLTTGYGSVVEGFFR